MRPRLIQRLTTTEEVHSVKLDNTTNPGTMMAFAMSRAKEGWRMTELTVKFERMEAEEPGFGPLVVSRPKRRRK